MRRLRPHLDEEEFVSRVGRLRADGYRLFGLFESGTDRVDGSEDENGKPRAVTGVAVEHNLYDGRYVWVYDLVTDEAHRSSGFGEQLCSPRDSNGSTAHRFYEERIGMEGASYGFEKSV